MRGTLTESTSHINQTNQLGWGPRLMMALVALIVTGLVGMLFGFGFGGSVLYCGIGLVVFMLLTAYDTQKLQQMYSYYAADSEMAEKASVYGALTLYLDFINIFLYVVRLRTRQWTGRLRSAPPPRRRRSSS